MTAGYSPDAVSYTTLITALSWLGRSADALQAFQDLDADPNAQADLYAYNAIINALSVAGRMDDAEEYLQRAAELAQKRREPAPVEAFGAIIKVCCCKRYLCPDHVCVLQDIFHMQAAAFAALTPASM